MKPVEGCAEQGRRSVANRETPGSSGFESQAQAFRWMCLLGHRWTRWNSIGTMTQIRHCQTCRKAQGHRVFKEEVA